MVKPLFRGILHLIASIVYIKLFPLLYAIIPSELKFPLTLYLLSVILNFSCSALFHTINWPKNIKLYLRRLDHVIIFIKILSTYYALIKTIFININTLVICVVTSGSIIGILLRIFYTDAPKIIIGIPYVLIGWAILLDTEILIITMYNLPKVYILLFVGGLSYTIGALFYILKYPNLCPKYFGPHELMHLLSVIGTSLFTICIFLYGIPNI
jgi:hemolysin III